MRQKSILKFKISRIVFNLTAKLIYMTHGKHQCAVILALCTTLFALMPTIKAQENKRILPDSKSSRLASFINGLNTENNDSIFKFIIRLGQKSKSPINYYDYSGLHHSYNFRNNPIRLDNTSGKITNQFDLSFYSKEIRALESFVRGVDSLKYIINKLKSDIDKYPLFECEVLSIEALNSAYHPLDRNIQISFYKKLMDSKHIYIINHNEDPKTAGVLYKLYSKKCHGSQFLLNYCGNNEFFMDDSICTQAISKQMDKLLKKNKIYKINDNQRSSFITQVTGLDDEYFEWSKILAKYESILSIAQQSFFNNSACFQTTNSAKFKYVGNTTGKGPLNFLVPHGAGYLLTEDNKIVMIAYWNQGFPIVLYELNIYYNNYRTRKHIYFTPMNDNAYPNHVINLDVYDKLDANRKPTGQYTYQVYIGQYEGRNINYSGFGANFYEDDDPNNKTFYIGEWRDSKNHGNGTLYMNSNIYKGKFVDDYLSYGTCIYEDGSTYIGEFDKDYRRHGRGKITNPFGVIINDGYFEYDNYTQSIEEYEKELQAKLDEVKKAADELQRVTAEQIRLAEERRRNEAEQSRKTSEEKEKSSFDLNKVKWKYINNSNLQCKCDWCGVWFRARRLSEFEILLQKAGLAYCFKSKEDPVLAPMMTDVDCSEIKMYKCDQFHSKECESEYRKYRDE